MSTTVTIRDQTTAGQTLHEWKLEVLAENATVRELIRGRVYQEVHDYNREQPEVFQGLVQPTDAEQTLNGYKLRKGRQIDWNTQFEKAVKAFEEQRVIVLVNDRQVESLDERVEITPDTDVTFLRLMLLVGG